MKFFLDTADLAEIEEAASWGALAGVTTNPSLYAKIGGKLDDFHNHMKRICDIVGPDCPVSAESVAMTRDEIVADGRKLAEIAPNIVVKIPTMVEGLAATHTLAAEGIPVNMTLCFSVPQALLAARAARSSAVSMTSPRTASSRSATSSPPSTTTTSRPTPPTASRSRSSPPPCAAPTTSRSARSWAPTSPPSRSAC